MKPTDEERREVAENLRDFESLREVFKESNICAFSNALGVGYMDWEHICARLADLIEPDPERTRRAEQDYEAMEDGIPDCRIWRCECGEKFPVWLGWKPIYCPACGAKVVDE